jgi:hypothetical protein
MLQTPPTIRTPRLDEIPNYEEVSKKLIQMQSAKIEEGFTFNKNSSDEFPFKFYVEININNFRLWELFKDLIALMPNKLSCIIT